MRLGYALAITLVCSIPVSTQDDALERGDTVRVADWGRSLDGSQVPLETRRIVAVPGDVVMMTEGGQVLVNGTQIDMSQEAIDAHRPFGPSVVTRGLYIVGPRLDSEDWAWGIVLDRHILNKVE